MTGIEQLLAGERAELAGDYLAAAAAYRAVSTDPNEQSVAEAHFRLGRVSWRQSRCDAALIEFETAYALALRLGAVELQARVANGIGAVHYARGDHAAARRSYADASALTQDGVMLGKIILNLGVIENIEGDLQAAREHYERAYRLFEEHEDTASATLALHNRGMVEADLQHWDVADASFLEALTLATADGNAEMIAKTLVSRSEVLSARGACSEAVEHCDRALAAYASLGDEVGRGEALRWRAHALRLTDDLVAAERSATEALQISTRCGSRLLEADASYELGSIRLLQSEPDGAIKCFQRALALFRQLGSRREISELEELLR